MAEIDKFSDVFFFALKDGFYSIVVCVAHPSSHVVFYGVSVGFVSEKDALHSSAHEHVHPNLQGLFASLSLYCLVVGENESFPRIVSLNSLHTIMCRWFEPLKNPENESFTGSSMYAANGKLLIYTSRFSSHNDRLRIINSAVAKIAKSLSLGIEVASTQKILSVYVYYQNEEGEETPIYCDWGKNWSEEDIYKAIRNMMFVLSFHPEYSGLQDIRKELCMPA